VQPSYRLDRSYEWNAVNGPDFGGPFPVLARTPLKTFLGLPVRSRFGIPAGLLPNSRWLEVYARLGFDILTYKTVRSVARPCAPAPNWLPLEEAELAQRLPDPEAALSLASAEALHATSTLAGSFGMPSVLPEMWMPDIERARRCIGPGQVLSVSVVGTAGPGTSAEAFIADFADVAARAVEAGAQVLELNLSCPNVGAAEGQIYQDVEMTERIARSVRRAGPGRPLLLKMGSLPLAPLRGLLQALGDSVAGIVMMNAPSRPIIAAGGQAAFGAGRERAGVTGAGILPLGLAAVRDSCRVIRELGLPLQVVAVGGISTAEDALAYLEVGACAAMSCTGAMINPLLAAELKARLPQV
jgi:dihydroorotate dehydrogenase